MKNHETHLQLTKTGQHRFFFVMILFLGAMNGLVLSVFVEKFTAGGDRQYPRRCGICRYELRGAFLRSALR